MEKKSGINTVMYDELGERWYTAHDDPVALLRRQSLTIGPWVISKLQENFGSGDKPKILDVGCGAGFLSNALGGQGFEVTGLDLSEDSLEVARKHDHTKKINYVQGDAAHLPFVENSFDAVTAMDFLEHVEDPARLVREVSRVLKPGGLFLYHTFNRNPVSWLVIIKFVEWFVRNTPKNLHLYSLFVKPSELKEYCEESGLKTIENMGIAPRLSSMKVKNLLSRTVPEDFEFVLTGSTLLSYIGYAKKNV